MTRLITIFILGSVSRAILLTFSIGSAFAVGESSSALAVGESSMAIAGETAPFTFRVPVDVKNIPLEKPLRVRCFLEITGGPHGSFNGLTNKEVPLVNGNFKGIVDVPVFMKNGKKPEDVDGYVCYLIYGTSTFRCSDNHNNFVREADSLCAPDTEGEI